MRITAKQIETLGRMIPQPSSENFSFGVTQDKGKTSLRVQDGKLWYKVKADGTFGGRLAKLNEGNIEPQSVKAKPKTEPVISGS